MESSESDVSSDEWIGEDEDKSEDNDDSPNNGVGGSDLGNVEKFKNVLLVFSKTAAGKAFPWKKMCGGSA